MASSILRKSVEDLAKPIQEMVLDGKTDSYIVKANAITAEIELHFEASTVPGLPWLPAKTQEKANTRLLIKAEYQAGYKKREKE